ncbi:MAG: hypothetical protein O6945_05055 [Gammaproteobacteria bacterium]|nr:hypothetical protein [Gammaproteobacteria bacterium]
MKTIAMLTQQLEAAIGRLERVMEVASELDSIQRYHIILTDDYFEFETTNKWDGPSDNVIMEEDFNRMLERIK